MTNRGTRTRYRVDERKYPDRLHWQFPVDFLGEDEHGMWFLVQAGTPALRESEPHTIKTGFVALVPTDDPWIAEFYVDSPTERIYVNIGTVPTVVDQVIHQVDLDLDVILTVDGDVIVVDEDEFAQHQVEFGYPQDVIDAARRATEDAVDRLTRRLPPFDGAAERWLDGVATMPSE